MTDFNNTLNIRVPRPVYNKSFKRDLIENKTDTKSAITKSIAEDLLAKADKDQNQIVDTNDIKKATKAELKEYKLFIDEAYKTLCNLFGKAEVDRIKESIMTEIFFRKQENDFDTSQNKLEKMLLNPERLDPLYPYDL